MARNRIIYQSEALYVSPASTGYHLQSGQGQVNEMYGAGQWKYNLNLSQDSAFQTGSLRWSGINDPATGAGVSGPVASGPCGPSGSRYRSLVEPLNRVQSINFDFNINRQDINEFGKLSRLDSIVTESPTVSLNFDYYLTDGENERKLGFNIPTSDWEGGFRPASAGYWTGDLAVSGYSALSGLIEDTVGNNYFILVGRESRDLADDPITKYISSSIDYEVISIGNGFISDYNINAAVGAIPTASLSVEGFNIKTDKTASGTYFPFEGGPGDAPVNSPLVSGNGLNFPVIPAVDQVNGQTGIAGVDSADYIFNESNGVWKNVPRFLRFSVPMYETGTAQMAALRPGDITFSMSNSGDYQGFTDMDGDGQAHLQSMAISVPLTRTVLQRLGNTFGYARVINLPMNIDISLSSVVSELNKNNLFESLTSPQKHTFTLTLHEAASTGAKGPVAMVFEVKNARLESETFSSAIGDNETVDITFSTQVGGSNDTDNGLFMNGSYFRFPTINYFPLGKNKTKDGAYKGVPPGYED
jgi:hypothetical protein